MAVRMLAWRVLRARALPHIPFYSVHAAFMSELKSNEPEVVQAVQPAEAPAAPSGEITPAVDDAKSANKRTSESDNHAAKKQKREKRKVGLGIGYVGAGYQGEV